MKENDSVEGEEFMDDESKIKLKLTIDRIKREAVFDFNGTSS
jgi:N-methylhydantoinase B/oxoprolinase/acetone carboxylase alpha subunit